MNIRKALSSDLGSVLSVERAAFGSEEEANLVKDLIFDPSAKPIVSLLASQTDRAIGHILFSAARLEPEAPLSVSILAPLSPQRTQTPGWFRHCDREQFVLIPGRWFVQIN